MSKSDLIFVEGVDRSGKNTLIRKLDKLCGYKYHFNPRGDLSNKVYVKKFGRSHRSQTMKEITEKSLIIYIDPSNNLELLHQRFIDTNELMIDYVSDMKMFEEELKTYKNYIIIPIDYKLEDVLKKVEVWFYGIDNN